MAEFTAKDVAALRARTGAGILDCRKALIENDGDIEKAVVWLREQGLSGATRRVSTGARASGSVRCRRVSSYGQGLCLSLSVS